MSDKTDRVMERPPTYEINGNACMDRRDDEWGDWMYADAADEWTKELRAEVERLKGLVHTAYLEGIADHATGDGRCGLDLWPLSNARAALAGKEEE